MGKIPKRPGSSGNILEVHEPSSTELNSKCAGLAGTFRISVRGVRDAPMSHVGWVAGREGCQQGSGLVGSRVASHPG